MANAWCDLNGEADSRFRSKSQWFRMQLFWAGSRFRPKCNTWIVLKANLPLHVHFLSAFWKSGPALQLRFVQCPSGVQVIIVNCFRIGQKNWSSICQAGVFEIAQKWNADRAANSPLLFVQQWKREFVQRNYKNGIWFGHLKMVLPIIFCLKVQPFYDIWQAEKSKAGS